MVEIFSRFICIRAEASEIIATKPSEKLEKRLRLLGASVIAGVDEAGRGPLAGPVVGAAVVLPDNHKIKGLNDSKKLTAAQRGILFELILDQALAVGVGIADVALIDRVNILRASLYAMGEAVRALKTTPQHVVVDGNVPLPMPFPQTCVVSGDQKVRVVAAASIVAKVVRDKIMGEYHKLYPVYGFDVHKGYGTAFHLEVIRKVGLSPLHRRFAQNVLQEKLF